MEDILAITFLFGGGAVFLLSISPVGRAIADRIRRGPHAMPQEEVTRIREAQVMLLEEIETLRNEVADVREQLDFTERMLTQQRDRAPLPPATGDHA
jgi:uncharacterized protein YlxW (UPF0749 family)